MILDIEGNVGFRKWGGDGKGFEKDIVQAEVVVGARLSGQISMGELVMCRKDDERRDEAAAVQKNIIM